MLKLKLSFFPQCFQELRIDFYAVYQLGFEHCCMCTYSNVHMHTSEKLVTIDNSDDLDKEFSERDFSQLVVVGESSAF